MHPSSARTGLSIAMAASETKAALQITDPNELAHSGIGSPLRQLCGAAGNVEN